MASQVSLPSTPQQNTSYDTYMQSLQQKLSSISMQNASTLGPLSPQTTLISLENAVLPSLESTLQLINDKLHVDSSAPTSGTATTEMLSPVQEFDAVSFPASPPSSTNETPKHTSFKNLNHELTKINSRKESAVSSPFDSITTDPSIELQASVAQTEFSHQSDHFESAPVVATVEKTDTKPVEKIRRVSRFKVSVVAEPDPSKLIIKPEAKNHSDEASTTSLAVATTENIDVDKHTALKQVPSLQDIPSLDNHLIKSAHRPDEIPENGVKIHDSVTLINNTMLQLQENVQTSYLSQAKSIIAAVPSGWTTEHNETFEDMLGRQQAELNALIEAHRKQQIEYMKSITEVSKNSSSNSNRKDS